MTQMLTAEQIRTYSREATSLMEAHEAVPAPESYELFYWYASRRNEAITSAVEQAIGAGLVPNLEHTRELHARFFGPSVGTTMEEVGEQLGTELRKITDDLRLAGNNAAAFDRALATASNALDSGKADVRLLVQKLAAATRAIQARNQKLEEQLATSMQEVEAIRGRMETVRKESLTDALTGLANRRSFDETAERAIETAVTERRPLSLVICDVDHFKKFNDTYGHPIGDQVLRLVGQCLKVNVKGKDTAARFGGEEFVVILPETTLAQAAHLANEIRKTVGSKRIVQKSTGRDMGTVTLSLGVAALRPGETVADLLNRADTCLYAAKRAGRDRVITETDASAQAHKTLQ
jgi:diguanylate cyclase